jgi:hypothetical protein
MYHGPQVISTELVESLVGTVMEFPRVLQLPSFRQVLLAEDPTCAAEAAAATTAGAGAASAARIGGDSRSAAAARAGVLASIGGGGGGGAASSTIHLGGPELKSILPGLKPLQKARLAVGNSVDHAYRSALASVSQYDALRVLHEFCITWDAEAYKVRGLVLVCLVLQAPIKRKPHSMVFIISKSVA